MTEEKIKNILLFGRVEGGKTALANLLTDGNKFAEYGYIEILQNKCLEFELKLPPDYKSTKYRVIDTISIGNNRLDTPTTLSAIFSDEVINFIEKDGLNQIFFVFSGVFEEGEVRTYDLLKSIIFDSQVLDYTTIVRTRFNEFEDENA